MLTINSDKKKYFAEDNDRYPWVEIYNRGDTPVDMSTYALRMDGDPKRVWQFPAVSVRPGNFLRIWGSGKNRTAAVANLHTSFPLHAAHRVELISVDGKTLFDQLDKLIIPAGQSYGRYPDGGERKVFFSDPTPEIGNSATRQQPFVVSCKHLSLPVGKPYRLTVTDNYPVSWKSDNPNVTVDSKGTILAKKDFMGAKGRARITATAKTGGASDFCEITIVNWVANRSSLTVAATPSTGFLLTRQGNRLYHTAGPKSYYSTDGMRTSNLAGSFPEQPDKPIVLNTPMGHFARTGNKIYRSADMVNWTEIKTTKLGGLVHMFDYEYDEASQTLYLYSGEYSVDANNRHSVVRGKFTSGGAGQWEEVKTFDSKTNWEKNGKLINAVRHIHVVTVDPYTGHIWVGTGDRNEHARLYYSRDRGKTFHLVAMGSQTFRTLSIWFTKGYVYWNTDSESEKQVISRISRKHYTNTSGWPALTPLLKSGKTRKGITYYHLKTGRITREDHDRKIKRNHPVIAIDDPQYRYDEVIAELANGSHWYHMWVKDRSGSDIVLMPSSAEGKMRDDRGRVFGIKERPDGTVDVQELISFAARSKGPLSKYVQWIPGFQDEQGYIYFNGRETWHRIYKTELDWVDQ
jgi:hypothetical protein